MHSVFASRSNRALFKLYHQQHERYSVSLQTWESSQFDLRMHALVISAAATACSLALVPITVDLTTLYTGIVVIGHCNANVSEGFSLT